MQPVTFYSQYAKHVLTLRPDYAEVVNGIRRVVRGKRIEFRPLAGGRGRYTTADPEEIQFLREHPDMRTGVIVEASAPKPPPGKAAGATLRPGAPEDQIVETGGPAAAETGGEPALATRPTSLVEVNYLKLQAFARSQGIAVPAGTKRADLAAQLAELGFTAADVLGVEAPEAPEA